MTSSTAPLRRSAGEAAVPALASISWLALAALLLADVDTPAALAVPLLIAVAATAFTIVRFVRRRSSGRPNGALVAGLLAPAIALAAMTPLFAVAGEVVFVVFALVAALETAILAIVSARKRNRG